MSKSIRGRRKYIKCNSQPYKSINPYTLRNENILLNIITPSENKVNRKYCILHSTCVQSSMISYRKLKK